MMLSQVVLISLVVVVLPKDATGSAARCNTKYASKYKNISQKVTYMYNSAAAFVLSHFKVLTGLAIF